MPDAARLEAILASLPPDDAVFLAGLVEPPWKARARRLSLRDDAIRLALGMLADDPRPCGRLAMLLADPHLAVDDADMGGVLSAILEGNNGKAMVERQLRRIATGSRTPEAWT